MKRTSLPTGNILMFSILAVFMLFASNALAAEKVLTWKLQSAFPRGDLSMQQLDHFAEEVSNKSNGRLIINVFAEPELVGGDVLPEAVKNGVLQMCHIAPPPYSGVNPISAVEAGLPFQYVLPEYESYIDKANAIRDFFFTSGMVDIIRKEYAKHGLYWLDMHIYGPVPFILSKNPVVSVADFKGKKIRDGGIWTTWHNAMGARGTFMPGSEVYMALKLGTVDMAQWDVSAVTGLKWHEVAPYWVTGTENDHMVGNMSVNLKAWQALPADLQKALSDAAKSYYDHNVKGYAAEIETVQTMANEGTVKISKMGPELIQLHKDTAIKIWDDVARKNAACAQAIALVKEWRGIQ